MSTAFLIRLPDDLADLLREAARMEDRKLTAEITRRLRQSFEMPLMTRDADPVGYTAKPSRQTDAEVTPLFKKGKRK